MIRRNDVSYKQVHCTILYCYIRGNVQYRLEHLLKTLDDLNGRLEMIKNNVIKFVGDAAATDDVSLLEIKTLVIDDDNLLKS
jgi:UDP-N-acetylmuramoylalanine-D-glutamate ligase